MHRPRAGGGLGDGGALPVAACWRWGVYRPTALVLGVLLLAVLPLAACGGTERGSGPPASTSRSQAPPTAARASPATTPASPATLTVRSPSFADGAAIPVRFSCRGGNTPPSLAWTGIPSGAASIAVVMDDPDAIGGTYTHWVVFNLPATARGITGGRLPPGAAQAQNSGGQATYLGPCPPSGTHHYRFTVYAEPNRLPLPAGAPLAEALHAIKADALTSGQLTGLFSG